MLAPLISNKDQIPNPTSHSACSYKKLELNSINMEKEEIKGDNAPPDDENQEMEQFEVEPKTKLSKEDVDKAEKLISQRYPLNYLAIEEVFTFLRPLMMWRKKQKAKKTSEKFKKLITAEAIKKKLQSEKTGGLKVLTETMARSSHHMVQVASKPQEEKMDHDPMNLFGIGIVAQFDLMKYLIFAFILFSILSIPIILIYSGYDAMRGTKKESYTASTLGNFGFSTSTCYSIPKRMQSMILF